MFTSEIDGDVCTSEELKFFFVIFEINLGSEIRRNFCQRHQTKVVNVKSLSRPSSKSCSIKELSCIFLITMRFPFVRQTLIDINSSLSSSIQFPARLHKTRDKSSRTAPSRKQFTILITRTIQLLNEIFCFLFVSKIFTEKKKKNFLSSPIKLQMLFPLLISVPCLVAG